MRHIKLAQHAIPKLQKDTAIWVKRDVKKELQQFEFAYRTDSGKQFEFRNVFGEGVILQESPYGKIGERIWLKEHNCMTKDEANIIFEVIDVDVDRKHVGVSVNNPWAWVIKMRVL